MFNKEPSAEQVRNDKLYLEMGLTEEEYSLVIKYLGRFPNYTETGLFAVLWSEHCSYKNSKRILRHLPTEGDAVLQGPGEGAGVVDIGGGKAVVFKIESHNHPSAVEPYQGAATGVGGILRDVFSMGAQPIAVLNSLRLGELDNDRNKYLLREITAGIAGYGNTVGVPTLGGEVQFDAAYDGNPLVNAMAVGLVDHENLQKGLAAGVGNVVIYAGAETGRDGIHGATFASEEFSTEKDSRPSALQVAYPEVGKRLLTACLEAAQSPALVGMQDMGAAGLTSSSAEMASKAGTGIDLDLDSVPQRDEGMTAYELMLSESQERMLLVAEEGREQEIIDIFLKHGLTAAVIGKITDTKRLRVSQSGAVVADVPVAFLVDNAPVYDRRAKAPAYYSEFQEQGEEIPEIEDLKATFLELLAQPTISSKAVLYEQFKGGENVVRGPGSNAGVIAVEGTNKGLALTVDCNSRYIYLDPYMGGAIAVAEAARNIICSGGKPLAVTDGLNFGNPYNEEIFWQMEQSVLGISEACRRLGTPVVGGNVSLFNETGGRAIYPTPIIGMVGIVEDLSLVTAKDFQNPGDLIYLLGETLPEFGGSELQKLHFGRIFGRPPRLDLKREKELQKQVKEAIKARLVQSAHDVSTGGLGIALAECLMDKKLGAAVNLANDPVTELFSESQSRFILTVKPSKQAEFEAIAKDAVLIGEVKAARELTFTAGDKLILALDGEEMAEVWKGALPCLLQTKS